MITRHLPSRRSALVFLSAGGATGCTLCADVEGMAAGETK